MVAPKSTPSLRPTRRDQLAAWVVAELSTAQPGHNPLPLHAIGDDASFRKYYRIQTPQGTQVAVDAPPQTEDSLAFVTIARQWQAHHIRVPAIHGVNLEKGFLLLEDFGDRLFQDGLTPQSADTLYDRALTLLQAIQQLPADALPDYDESLLRFELSLFPDWFLGPLLGLELTPEEQQMLTGLFDRLVDSALTQPQVTVHRDFHCRNLMLCADGELGVIDFQGALHGPLLYDVVSLLKDCYQCWPEEKIQQWLQAYSQRQPRLASVDYRQIRQWFDWLGLQRHLKCLGIFSRLWLRDNKPGYLEYLPGTFNYVLNACQHYPELAQMARWLEQRISPLLRQRIRTLQDEVKA